MQTHCQKNQDHSLSTFSGTQTSWRVFEYHSCTVYSLQPKIHSAIILIIVKPFQAFTFFLIFINIWKNNRICLILSLHSVNAQKYKLTQQPSQSQMVCEMLAAMRHWATTSWPDDTMSCSTFPGKFQSSYTDCYHTRLYLLHNSYLNTQFDQYFSQKSNKLMLNKKHECFTGISSVALAMVILYIVDTFCTI